MGLAAPSTRRVFYEDPGREHKSPVVQSAGTESMSTIILVKEAWAALGQSLGAGAKTIYRPHPLLPAGEAP